MTDYAEQQEALERKLAILMRLANLSVVLNSTMKLKPLLGTIMDTAAEITDAEAASVLLWDQKTNELRFAATTSGTTPPEIIGRPVPLEGSIAGTIVRENRIVVVNNVTLDPRHYNKLDEQIAFRTRSVLGVPLTSRNRIIGVLEAVNKRNLPWTQDDCVYLSILAAQAAVAIEGAQLVARLEKANEELSQVDKLKTDFIAIASHELRTPLGVILGYATFLQDTSDTEVSDHAAKVVNSALHLRSIIEDLTNLRYLQASESDLHRENVALRDLIADLARDMQTQIAAKRHKLTLRVPDRVVVNVDRSHMVLALSKVLNNAVRFTPEGGEINIVCEVQPPFALVSISDNGIGIEKAELERIFERFYQVEDHMTRHHGGLGIGLSICKGLVEAHGGRIWAASPGVNQGATFTISIPLA